jgi:RNA polymerase sigma-70 factor (ECF subfamily)
VSVSADRSDEIASRFATTRWDVVLASAETQVPGADRALTELCRTYWPPLYAFVRRRGYSVADAEDLVQEFFAHFLQDRAIKKADSGRGRFRTFLLTSLSNFLANEWDRAGAAKRGGKFQFIAIDQLAAAEWEAAASDSSDSAEMAFDVRWAQTIIDAALAQLRDEAKARGKGEVFETLRRFLAADNVTSYEAAAAELNMPASALKTAIHRLRANFRAVVRREVARTVASPSEIEEELRYLRSVLASSATGRAIGC